MSKDTDVVWITALRRGAIRTLVQHGAVRMGLFDEHNLLEISSADFPGERLVACRNPELVKLRAHTRDDLLAATEKDLQGIQARAAAGKSTLRAGKLVGADQIGVAVGKVVIHDKVARHFELLITDNSFTFQRAASHC